VVLVSDHFTPAKDILSAEQCKVLRNFAKAHHLTYFFEAGEAGIEHALLPEKGLVLPGDLVIGADSHTCTYGALGAFSTGVGSTDLGAVMATGRLWFKVPESLNLIFYGKLNPWVFRKGLHSLHDRGNRCRRGSLSGNGILRRDDEEAAYGGTAHHLQYGG